MPKESDWIFYAPYSDKTLIRNVLVYETARLLEGYASRHAFVELVLNDSYEGVYVLFEKIKRDKNRVDISKLNDDITGGYILELTNELELHEETESFKSEQLKRVLFYTYPKAKDISAEQRSYIKTYVTDFEAALYADDFLDRTPNYREFIDTESFIDYVLLSEVFKNKDYFISSTYLHKDKEGLLNLGPLWDFNLSLGNVEEAILGESSGFLINNRPSSANRLLEDPEFAQSYKERFKQLRKSHLSTETLLSRIDAYVSELEGAQQRNFKRWPILGSYIWPNRFVGDSYEEEIRYLKDWLSQRLEWFDQNIDSLGPKL